MHRPDILPVVLERELADAFGPVRARSASYSFDQTAYYETEMGPGLVKWVAAFTRPVAQESLPEIKLRANALEEAWRDARGRRVNVDPGLLTPASLVLATTKGFAHRIYLGRGIYGEVTLIFRRGRYESLPWTYPDYRTPQVLDFLAQLRRADRRRGAGGDQPSS
jgi:hypothetical protein